MGSNAHRAAMGWQIYELTGSELDLGLPGLAKFAPVLLFGIAGGVIADRGDRRRTLQTSQLLLTVAVSLALLTFTGLIDLWLIYGLAFLDGVFFSIATPTRRALIANLVSRASLFGAGPAVAVGGLLALGAVVAVGALMPAVSRFRLSGAIGDRQRAQAKVAAD